MWSFSKASTPTLTLLPAAADAKLARNAADACALVAHGADRSDLGRVGVLKRLAAEPLRQSQEKIRGVGW
jgi:hypothetical protein